MTCVLEFGNLTSGTSSRTTLLLYREKKKQCSNVVREEVPLVKFPNSRTQVIFRLKSDDFLGFKTCF